MNPLPIVEQLDVAEDRRLFFAAWALAAVRDFRSRPQQLELAQRIAVAIAGNLALVTEAGAGKTFAYQGRTMPRARAGRSMF